MTKRIKILIFVLAIFATLAIGQKIDLGKGGVSKIDLEKIINQSKEFGRDTIALKKFLSPLIENKKSKQFEVIYNVLYARGIAVAQDSINAQSNEAFEKSIEIAKKNKFKSLEVWATLQNASYLYNYREMTQSLPLFMNAKFLINELPENEIIFPSESFKSIGYYFGTIGDNDEAISNLTKAKQFAPNNSSEYAAIVDNIGMYLFNKGEIDEANKNFVEAATVAKTIGDSVRYGKALGNQSLIYTNKKDYQTAIKLLLEDIHLSEINGSNQNTMYAYTLLARNYLNNNQIPEAKDALQKAEAIATTKSYFKISELEIVKMKLEIFIKTQDKEQELFARRRVSQLEDSLKMTDGDIPLKKANWMAQKSSITQELDKTNERIKHEATLKSFYSVIALLAIGLTALLFINSRRILKSRQDNYDKKVLSFELDKLKYEQKLNDVNSDLNTQISYLKEKNNQIKNLHAEIESIKNSSSSYIEEKSGKLNALLESHLMTEENWRNFKREFQKEHPQWYQEITKEYSALTESNLRIVILNKLGFGNNEISELLGISSDSVRKAKQRIRKKLGEQSDFALGENQNPVA